MDEIFVPDEPDEGDGIIDNSIDASVDDFSSTVDESVHVIIEAPSAEAAAHEHPEHAQLVDRIGRLEEALATHEHVLPEPDPIPEPEPIPEPDPIPKKFETPERKGFLYR